MLFYLKRSWVLGNKHGRQPGHALALAVPCQTAPVLTLAVPVVQCCAVL